MVCGFQLRVLSHPIVRLAYSWLVALGVLVELVAAAEIQSKPASSPPKPAIAKSMPVQSSDQIRVDVKSPDAKSSNAKLLDAQLAAGEFAPAVRSALDNPERAARDTLLARVAYQQSNVGATQQAIRTATEIQDDLLRSESLHRSRARPLDRREAAGGTQADFDSLINLITSTIAPPTWDVLGGPGAVDGFEGGVYCDPAGVLRPLLKEERTGRLAMLRRIATSAAQPRSASVQAPSNLRKISLTRLERQLQARSALGEKPTEEMRALAGLQRVKFVIVDAAAGDIILAGPAGDWKEDREGRLLSVEGDQPILQLDDLVVVLRHMLDDKQGKFGCSITPTQENLARTQSFLKESNKTPLKPGGRDAWLKKLQAELGRQNIDVYGIDPRTRVARVLVEADYRMKLVGLGLEESVLGVKNYLDSIVVKPGEAPPSFDVLRWWFTLNYDAVLTSPDHDIFEIRGQGVKVLSENELLTATGAREHTGQASEANHQFTNSFTEQFPRLAERYPIYAELRNIFDLALVGAILKSENLPSKIHRQLPMFGSDERFIDQRYSVALGQAPQTVDTVIAHRTINRIHILVGVSGGVACDALPLVGRDRLSVDKSDRLSSDRAKAVIRSREATDDRQAWWWD